MGVSALKKKALMHIDGGVSGGSTDQKITKHFDRIRYRHLFSKFRFCINSVFKLYLVFWWSLIDFWSFIPTYRKFNSKCATTLCLNHHNLGNNMWFLIKNAATPPPRARPFFSFDSFDSFCFLFYFYRFLVYKFFLPFRIPEEVLCPPFLPWPRTPGRRIPF